MESIFKDHAAPVEPVATDNATDEDTLPRSEPAIDATSNRVCIYYALLN